jgi:hypothetical protein
MEGCCWLNGKLNILLLSTNIIMHFGLINVLLWTMPYQILLLKYLFGSWFWGLAICTVLLVPARPLVFVVGFHSARQLCFTQLTGCQLEKLGQWGHVPLIIQQTSPILFIWQWAELQEGKRKLKSHLRPKLRIYSVTFTAFCWLKQVTRWHSFTVWRSRLSTALLVGTVNYNVTLQGYICRWGGELWPILQSATNTYLIKYTSD